LYCVVVVVVVVVDHDENGRTTPISRPVEVGFPRRLDRMLPLTLPLTMRKRIIQFGLFLIEVWHFKKKTIFQLVATFSPIKILLQEPSDNADSTIQTGR
jgi:hypothetical protein